MEHFFLPFLLLFVPFLLLFYTGIEIYVRNPSSRRHQITMLLNLSLSLLFLGEFLSNVLPEQLALFPSLYFSYIGAFSTMIFAIYFFQSISKPAFPLYLQHVSALIPGSGILFILIRPSWIGISFHQTPIWRYEEPSFGLTFLSVAMGIYTICFVFFHLMFALKGTSREQLNVKQRQQVWIVLTGTTSACVWILFAGLVLVPLARPYDILPLAAIPAYGSIFFAYSLRYMMVNYDFLSSASKRYELLFSLSRNGIAIVCPEGRVLEANPAYQRMIGCQDDSWRGVQIKDLFFFENQVQLEQLKEAFTLKIPYHGEVTIRNHSGKIFNLEIDSELIEIETNIHTFYSCRDITEQKANESKLAHLAYHDALTGLGNRLFFQEQLELALAAMSQDEGEGRVGVLLLDVDHFKWINDTMGHSTGDLLLKLLAVKLEEVLPSGCLLARLGGDEFAVMIPAVCEVKGAVTAAEQLLRGFQQPIWVNGQSFTVSASIGISIASRNDSDYETLLRHADMAMYVAKGEGRNQYHLFNPNQQTMAMQHLKLLNELDKALERDEFMLHYQPQIELQTNKLIGVEALLRWQSDELGQVSPADFIPIAEETGAILPIGDWVLRTAMFQGKRWIDAGHTDLIVSANLSARQLREPLFTKRLVELLEESGLPPGNLCLEITESTAILNAAQTLQMCKDIVSLGVSLAIDDFGTGYSSLSMISRFPFRTIKIDRALIQDIESSKRDAAVIRTIVKLAHHLDMQVLAEGVETPQQLNLLRRFGCHHAQGYLCGKPMQVDEIDVHLKHLAEIDAADSKS